MSVLIGTGTSAAALWAKDKENPEIINRDLARGAKFEKLLFNFSQKSQNKDASELTAPPPHGRYPFISKGFRGYYFIHLFTNSYIFLSSATNKNGLWPIFI